MTEPADLVIRGGRVLRPDGVLEPADVTVDAGRIVAADGARARRVIDAAGMIVAPGFVDLQVNGGWGHDFTTDPASLGAVAAELPATGVTAFLPTIVSSTRDRRAAAIAAVGGHRPAPGAAAVLGLHFEGPMIAAGRAGAHDHRVIGPVDPDEYRGWGAAGVRLVTLAPETPGALEAVTRLSSDEVLVSIGHTACSAGEFAAARAAGARAVTHLFNAMAPFGHRSPGPIGATLADPGVVAGLICDNIHVDPVAVAAAWRALGPDRIVLVTDAMAGLGLPVGTVVPLGAHDAFVGAAGVRLADGTLAGSNLTMDAAVRNLVDATGCTAAQALGCASRVPADLLGLHDRGRIEPGARADVVLLDEYLHVRHTLVGGVTAWRS